MTTFDECLVTNERAQTRVTRANIILSDAGKVGSESEKVFVELVRRITRSVMVCFRLMNRAEEGAMKTVLSKYVIRGISKEVAWSDRLMRPTAVFARDNICHHIKTEMVENLFLNIRGRITVLK